MSMTDTSMGRGQDRELVLPPGTFAFVLDSTKGKVSAYVGSHKASLSATDTLVVWDPEEKKIKPVDSFDRAIQTFIRAEEGQYVVLSDPAVAESQPSPPEGVPTESVRLNVGRSVIIPGPTSFPLWPGQSAETVDGHHLRHNQYLVVRVINPVEAAANWNNAVMAPQVALPEAGSSDGDDGSGDSQGDADSDDGGQPPVLPTTVMSSSGDASPPSFTMGQLLIIKGTDVSFYIPSTGIEVIRDPETRRYVRDAATLEQLEYCILLDEAGTKRFVRGPAVVFPEPTETFVTNGQGERKSRAIELDDRTGIYVKVIAAYTDDDGDHPVGEELFISGSNNGIYFPRPEHSIIEYDGKRKHHAIAIPVGEGRYVLNRDEGRVDTVKGPRMFLPDPRKEVVVRRVLDARTVNLLYPHNEEALRVNARYEREAAQLDPGEYLGGAERQSFRGMAPASALVEEEFVGESEQRRSQYSPPRTVVLDNKYEGAVGINIWPGYAVMVTNKSGARRVELGPKAILLDYDEILMPMELSTGKPKTTDNLLRTAYLRTTNNKISDIVEVETKDLVKVRIKISIRANFVGNTDEERERWFDVENYVKVLCDHVRSRLRGEAKRHGIQEFYRDSVDTVRDTILGRTAQATDDEPARRPGLVFEEFGLHVYDVEVLSVEIQDSDVAHLLQQAQSRALEGAIALSEAEDESARISAREALNRANMKYAHETVVEKSRIEVDALRIRLETNMANVTAELEQARAKVEVDDLRLAESRKASEQARELLKADNEVLMERMKAEAEVYASKLEAISPELSAALQHFGNTSFIEKLVDGLGPIAAATGVTTADLFKNVFAGTPFEGMMATLADRPLAQTSGNGRGYRD